MGAGVAKVLALKHSNLLQEYRSYLSSVPNPLGTVQYVLSGERYVVNMFAQDGYSTYARQTDYEAFRACLVNLASSISTDEIIAMPYGIGCGLAGGEWNIVYQMIEDVLKNHSVELYRLR